MTQVVNADQLASNSSRTWADHAKTPGHDRIEGFIELRTKAAEEVRWFLLGEAPGSLVNGPMLAGPRITLSSRGGTFFARDQGARVVEAGVLLGVGSPLEPTSRVARGDGMSGSRLEVTPAVRIRSTSRMRQSGIRRGTPEMATACGGSRAALSLKPSNVKKPL